MKKFAAKLIYGIAAIEIVGILVLAFIAYFVSSYDPITGAMSDGLGRPLERAPFLAQLVFGEDDLWAGWGYFIVDMIVFWGGLGIGFGLIKLGARFEGANTNGGASDHDLS